LRKTRILCILLLNAKEGKMTKVAATEFARNFGRYREEAQREPVAVVTHNRVTGYFVSARDYDEYQRLKATAPTALAVEELDGATLKALAALRMDSRHDHLNALMD
jgi:PHD/YefM family antitoxin component YafN of YafNO toxin-antitoxin module